MAHITTGGMYASGDGAGVAGVASAVGAAFRPGKQMVKGTLLGTPNREPQEYSRNIMECKDPGRYIPSIYLLYSWGSLFGVPSRVPLMVVSLNYCSQNGAKFM